MPRRAGEPSKTHTNTHTQRIAHTSCCHVVPPCIAPVSSHQTQHPRWAQMHQPLFRRQPDPSRCPPPQLPAKPTAQACAVETRPTSFSSAEDDSKHRNFAACSHHPSCRLGPVPQLRGSARALQIGFKRQHNHRATVQRPCDPHRRQPTKPFPTPRLRDCFPNCLQNQPRRPVRWKQGQHLSHRPNTTASTVGVWTNQCMG